VCRLPLTLIHPGPERLMLGGQVADPADSLGKLTFLGSGATPAVADGVLFGGAERLDLLVWMAAA
jgi:hypothetical protein